MFYNRNLLNFCEAQGKDIFGLGMHFKAFLEILGYFKVFLDNWDFLGLLDIFGGYWDY